MDPAPHNTETVPDQARIRPATLDDVPGILSLFRQAYGGRYRVDFVAQPDLLAERIGDPNHLVLVASLENVPIGCVFFAREPESRLGKAAGAVVHPHHRDRGVGTRLIRAGIELLTEDVDVVYALTRTLSEAPSRMVQQTGFLNMGLFPNAVEVDQMEHLNLDVLVTDRALRARRPTPTLYGPYREVFELARDRLGLEEAQSPGTHRPLYLDTRGMDWTVKREGLTERFAHLQSEGRLSNCFFPFHRPNVLLKARDGSSEVFAWIQGKHRQAAILGYRTDRTHLQNVLDSAARTLNRLGASYVELLVDVYDFHLQQQAFTARFIPSGYFPALHLASDGLREDRFIVSRTFNLLDFSEAILNGSNRPFLKAYLRRYYDLYFRPILEDEKTPGTDFPQGDSTPAGNLHRLDLH